MQKRNGYREGKRGVQAWFPLALYGQMRGLAEAEGVTLQRWLEDAVRMRLNTPVVERESQPKPVVKAATPDWDAILAAGAKPVVVEPVVVEADPWLEIA